MNGASIDGSWFTAVAGFAQRTGWLHPLMSAYTNLSILLLAALALAGWWYARRRADPRAMSALAWTGIGTALTVAAGLASKQLFTEPRPCRALPRVHIVAACPAATDYAFPSDHTLIAVALAAGLWLVERRLGAVAALLALGEGFSRIYLGEHYPHDVAASLLLGTAVIAAGWPLVQLRLAAVMTRLEHTPVRALLTAAPGTDRGDLPA